VIGAEADHSAIVFDQREVSRLTANRTKQLLWRLCHGRLTKPDMTSFQWTEQRAATLRHRTSDPAQR
jgi:hypothetical protein